MFRWSDYLSLAQELNGRTDEAALRCAISRAYYAAYCSARDRLIIEAPSLKGNSSHFAIWNEYMKSSNILARDLGAEGNSLRNTRREADYDLVVNGDLAKLTQDAIITASTILDTIPRISRILSR